MYRFKTLTAAVAVASYTSLSRTHASLCAAEEGKISDGSNVRKVLPPHLQSDNVAKLTCESSASGGICDVFLVGTTHGSPESKREVENLIHYLKPEVVFLEQYPTRVNFKGRLTGGFDPHSVRVKSSGKDKLEVAVKRVGEEEGYTISINGSKASNLADCEFIAAYLLAIIYDRKVILGDRPIKITNRRFKSASFWDFMKLIYYKDFSNESPSHKLIQSMFMENFNKVIVDERDQYMSVKLLEAARQHSSVVAVVGSGHLEGIQKYWKQPVDLEQLLEMPRDPVMVAFCVLSSVSVGAFCIIRKIRFTKIR